jgi:chemotaxis protein histidine kinase CheA
MRERAQQLGATLALESAPGQGTRIALRLPLAGPIGRLWRTLSKSRGPAA